MSVDAVKLGELQDVKSVPDAAVVTISSPAGAQQVSFANLIKQVEDRVKADLLGGRTVSPSPGQVMEVTVFPAYEALRAQGYIPQDTQSKNIQLYFEGLLRYLVERHPKGGVFVGRAVPGAEGVCLIDIYAQGTVEGLPRYSSGNYFGLGGTNARFGTSDGEYSFKQLST